MIVGSRVSFRYEETTKGGNAKEVRVEETAPAEEEGPRENGTVKSWNAEKGFGFIEWSGEKDAFAHKRDVASGNDLEVGQFVSFVVEDGLKGASAKKIQEEEGMAPVVDEEDEGERMFGKVKVSTVMTLLCVNELHSCQICFEDSADAKPMTAL